MDSILNYAAIFFDFDGLLVNTEHLHFEAYQQMLLQNHASFPWDFQAFAYAAHCSSKGLQKMITDHIPELIKKKGWKALYNEKKLCYQSILNKGHLELMPGVKQVLNLVKERHIPHAVVTNSTKAQVDLIRKHLPFLNQIPHWITREDYAKPKPAPDGYIEGIEQLKIKGKTIGFEDTLRGIESLKKANIEPVLICSPKHPQMKDINQQDLHYFPSFEVLLSNTIYQK